MYRANHHRSLNRLTEAFRGMREKLIENAMDALRLAAYDLETYPLLPRMLAEAILAAKFEHESAVLVWLRDFARLNEDAEAMVPPAYIHAVMAVRYMKEALELEHSEAKS